MVELRATETAPIRIHESSAPIRPATTTWGVMIRRNPHSKVGYDLPDAVVSELAADGMGRFASG